MIIETLFWIFICLVGAAGVYFLLATAPESAYVQHWRKLDDGLTVVAVSLDTYGGFDSCGLGAIITYSDKSEVVWTGGGEYPRWILDLKRKGEAP